MMARKRELETGAERRGALGRREARLLAAVAAGRIVEPGDGAPAVLADALVARDLAAWRGDGGSLRLVVTPAGAARLRREAAASGETGERMRDTAFLAQHVPLREEAPPDGRGPRILTNAAESPLAWLRGRKGPTGAALIDEASFLAGERLRAEMTRAAMLPRVTADWSPTAAAGRGRGPAEATDAALAARQRVARALEAVGGDLAGVLVDVCGFLKGLEQVEKERGWPARSAKVVLGLALRRLAAHYGYANEARGPGASKGVRSWLPPESRPRAG